MRRPEWIARQAECPRGFLGRLLGAMMAFETTPENVLALEHLALRPTDHLLEVGCGHGRTVQRAAAWVPQGAVAGIDVSEQMVRMARRRNRALIKAGRVAITRADSAHLPFPDGQFDRVLSVHTLYFWAQPGSHLQEIARVMKSGARLLLCCRPGDDLQLTTNFPAAIYHFYPPPELVGLLRDTGFESVAVHRRPVSSGAVLFVTGQRGSTSPLCPSGASFPRPAA